jgi:hypothetical protein
MDVKTLIDEANKYADNANRQSYIEAKASRFKAWITLTPPTEEPK